MKKRGFTLVELLAVIVILAVIALITVPQVLRLIEDAQRDALKDSAYGIIEAGNLFYAKNSLSLFEEKQERVDFEIINNRFANVKNTDQKLDFKGKMPKSGKFQINSNGGTAISICNGKYCACKSATETMVTVLNENCAIDGETGEIESNVSGKKLKELEEMITTLEKRSEEKQKELEEKITALEKKKVLPGTVISYMASSTPPEGYLACDGKTYNISDYPKLAEAIKNGLGSYNYYGGDGTKTFAVPDLRGEFLRGTGTNSHKDSWNRKEGDGAKVGKHQGGSETANAFLGNENAVLYTGAGIFAKNTDDTMDSFRISENEKAYYPNATFVSVTSSFSNQIHAGKIRPTNTSVLYCIKY